MSSDSKRADEFRRQAALCLDVARRISIKTDRQALEDMAEHWLRLADNEVKGERH